MKENIPDWAKPSPYDHYFYFLAPKVDRFKMLVQKIESLKLNYTVVPVAGNKHIFVFPQNHKTLRPVDGVLPFKGGSPVMLVAHYDRVKNSPGANDNSIAVFFLLKVAMILTQKGADNWIIVFTDKEELSPGESLEAQGSFTLGEKMKASGLEKARVFNFDVCGAGNTFILSTTTDHILKSSNRPNLETLKKNISQLRAYALEACHTLKLDNFLLAPTPFSDDVGFLRAGLASQTITILPGKEAEQYEALLRSRPEFANILISGKTKEPAERRYLPDTWKCLNNEGDTAFRLTPQYFEQVVNFAVELCK
ncbi:MAG: Zn-dependent exopeptidase M28 [Treponema sp.]|jgi:hypothetical protein|nr:Zn-dependent exopeptidase M28 [Treponema sp.]